MITTPHKILLIAFSTSSSLLISSCSTIPYSQETSNISVLPEITQATNSLDERSADASWYELASKGVELIPSARANYDTQEPELMVMGPAQVLALDSKYYAVAYGIDHTEAMRQMLIQHDNQKQNDALQAEFGDRIVARGLINEPEYGILITLTDTGALPPDRILYRPADKLSARETVFESYKTMTPEGVMLTQAELDKAMELIESPTRFIVKFEVSPKAKNLTEAQKQFMYERSNELNKQIPMLVGSSYDSTEGEYRIYVHEEDAKAARLTENKLKQIGEKVMKMPVRIKWAKGYATYGNE